MQGKKFKRKFEDFVCDMCGTSVSGSGYTNHCPNCLWSKHVDINPGDRENPCRGLMKPVGLDQKSGEFVVIHKCVKCGEVKRVRVSKHDDQKALRKLVNRV